MKYNKGISLIEILVSILILALIVGPFTGLFIQSNLVRKTMSKQIRVIYAVRNEMEILMSLNSGEVYDSEGVKRVDDLLIRTEIYTYDPETGSDCFYIMPKGNLGSGDEIMVLTPDGYRKILADLSEDPCVVDITISEGSYQIRIGADSISGHCRLAEKPAIQINLADKMSDISYDFNIDGDADITVYPGNHDNWNLLYDEEYRVVDRCFYRDYCIFRARIEAFDDPSLSKSIFGIENIFTVAN